MKPQLLLVTAGNLWNYKPYILRDQLALLPGHWLTAFFSCPDLFSILVLFPQSDTVLLGNISTLWQELLVRNCLLALSAGFLYKLLGTKFSLTELLRFQAHGTLCVRDKLTSSLCNFSTNIFIFVLTLLNKKGVALLPIPRHPDPRLVCHTTLLRSTVF